MLISSVTLLFPVHLMHSILDGAYQPKVGAYQPICTWWLYKSTDMVYICLTLFFNFLNFFFNIILFKLITDFFFNIYYRANGPADTDTRNID